MGPLLGGYKEEGDSDKEEKITMQLSLYRIFSLKAGIQDSSQGPKDCRSLYRLCQHLPVLVLSASTNFGTYAHKIMRSPVDGSSGCTLTTKSCAEWRARPAVFIKSCTRPASMNDARMDFGRVNTSGSSGFLCTLVDKN